MRRLLLLGVLVFLAAPSAALALRYAKDDGTLVVLNGAGQIRLQGPGAVIGRILSGQLELASESRGDCRDLSTGPADNQDFVLGADRGPLVRERDDRLTRCIFRERLFSGSPQAIRFRLILDDEEVLLIRSEGFWLSAVGEGRGVIRGAGGSSDGVYSLHGEQFASLPDQALPFSLAATVP
jgi:hypothetical protein